MAGGVPQTTTKGELIMSVLLPVRSFNRSQRVRIGGKQLSQSATTLAWLDNQRNQRDIGRHSAIGAVWPVGPAFDQNDDGFITSGGVVTVAGVTATTTAVAGVRAATGAAVSQAADTVALAAPVVNPRVDAVLLDTATPDIVKADGTATAGVNAFTLGGRPTLAANRIGLAYVVWAPAVPLVGTNATGAVASPGVVAYANHGFSNGQRLVVVTATGGTGLTVGNVYFVVNATTNTFQLSTTSGGAGVNFTVAPYTALQFVPAGDTAAGFQGPQVVDARPLSA